MKIFVGNLHENTSETMLRQLFSRYGKVTAVTLAKDGTGKLEGYGHIHMQDGDGCDEAIKKLNKLNFMNQFLDVYEASQE